MKSANLLSLSAIIVLTGLVASVGCAAPPTSLEEGEKDKSAASKGAKDDDDKAPSEPKTKPKTTPASATPTSSTPAATPITPAAPAGTGGTCAACLGANAQAKAFIACSDACTDDACEDACFETSCGAAPEACDTSLDACEAQCSGDGVEESDIPPGEGDGADCLACVGTGPAAQFITCSDACTDDACDEQCFETSCGANPDACESKLDQCEQACFGDE